MPAMNLPLESVAFVVGAAVSLATSAVLVTRLERVGERLGFTEALLGLVAALAADAPEITSAVSAMSHHQREIGIGVVLGSNVFNLAAMLGVGAAVAGWIGLHRRVVLFGGAVAMWVAIVSLLMATAVLSPPLALGLMLAVMVPYVVLIATPHGLRRRRWTGGGGSWLLRAVSEEEVELSGAIRPRRGTAGDAVMAGAALVVVVLASVIMERSASRLGTHFGVSEIIVGAVVLAAVTSLPNAVSGLHLGSKGRGAAMLSVSLNSNTLNVLFGLTVPALVVGLSPSSSGTFVTAWYVGTTALMLIAAYARNGLGRIAGWALIAGYLAFVGVLATR
jgi:cation:H+ antiporter